jgi:hypothetical protein
MPESILGLLALLVEGFYFFLLNEPKTVARMGPVGKYLAALFNGWVAVMSTASLILTFLPLLRPTWFKDSTVPAGYVWSGAVVCFAIANFVIWNKDQDTIRTLRTRPDVGGSVKSVRFHGILVNGNDRQEGKFIATHAEIGIYLINRNNVPTNLQKLILDGSQLEPPIEFREIVFRDRINLNFGIGMPLDGIDAMATLRGFNRGDDIPPIKLNRLRAYAVDGFMKWNWLKTDELPEIRFPQ